MDIFANIQNFSSVLVTLNKAGHLNPDAFCEKMYCRCYETANRDFKGKPVYNLVIGESLSWATICENAVSERPYMEKTTYKRFLNLLKGHGALLKINQKASDLDDYLEGIEVRREAGREPGSILMYLSVKGESPVIADSRVGELDFSDCDKPAPTAPVGGARARMKKGADPDQAVIDALGNQPAY